MSVSLPRLVRRLAVALSLWCGVSGIAAAQESRGYGDEELLLSYRREGDSGVAKLDVVEPNAGQPIDQTVSESASNPGAPREANPLRPATEATPVYTFPDARPNAVAVESVASPAYVAEASRYGAPQTPLEAPPAEAPAATPVTPVADQTVMFPSTSPVKAAPAAAPLHSDPSVEPTALAESTEGNKEVTEPAIAPPSPAASPLPTDDFRRLAPPTESALPRTGPEGERPRSLLPGAFSQFESLATAGAGLAVVVGLFFICMWLLRRSSGAKPTGILPNEAFAVLGRAPLTPQSFAHLLRVGNKLVLVAITPDGIQPLTEVVDPIEVDRLTGVCASGRGHGPAAEFQQVLAQLAREPARGFLGAEAATGGGRRRA